MKNMTNLVDNSNAQKYFMSTSQFCYPEQTHEGYNCFRSAPGHWTVHSGASACVCTGASFQWEVHPERTSQS